MGLSLRYYQADAVAAVYDHLRRKDSNPCVVLPTASGKSVCIGRIAADVVDVWHGRCLVIAAAKELLEQNAAKVEALAPGLDVGVYSAGLGRREADRPVVVGGIQSLYDKAAVLGHRDICIIDEVHQVPPDGDGMYRTFIDDLLRINPRMRVVGFTATDWRTGAGLICRPENILNEVCYEIGVRELMDRGFISKVVAKSGRSLPDISGLHVRAGEFVAEEAEAAVNRGDLVAEQCREIAAYTRDRQACLIFCSSVAHAEAVAGTMTAITGEECPVVTGDTPAAERARVIARLRGDPVDVDLFGVGARPLRYCANVSVLTTGTDIPRLDTIAMLRVTASSGLFLQIIGRGFRLSPGKTECLLLDYGRHVERFGPIDTIRGREPRAGGSREPLAKACPKCREMMPLHIMTCPSCGYEYPRPERGANLDPEASTDCLLSGETVVETHDVRRTECQTWTKRGAPPGAAKTVRVTYRIDLVTSYSEWLCPEHTGYARRKFLKWFEARRIDPDLAPPSTAEDLVEMDFMGLLRGTRSITVRHVAGQRYPEVAASEPSDEPNNPPALEGGGADLEEPPF